MSCRAAWNRDMLETCGLSKKFTRTTYKNRREDVLFERELGMMPATQPFAEKIMIIRNLEGKVAELNQQNIRALQKYSSELSTPLEVIAVDIQNDSEIECKLERIKRAYDNFLENQILMNERNMYMVQIEALNNTTVDPKRETRKFVRACPQNGCCGFLSTAWKCGICDKRACPQCHEPKDEVHDCKQECLETARLLAKDTKTCPKCATLIFKIEGCDQMWCTQCATAFSWRTGLVEVGRIHNPHYYEYQRSSGRGQREIGDIPCGGMPDLYSVRNKVIRLGVKTTLYDDIIRWHNHIGAVMMHDYVPRWNDNQDIRIKYMVKDLTQDVFKQKIQSREKDNEKRVAIGNVMNTYQVVSAEIMQRILASETVEVLLETTKEFEQIKIYVNDLMHKISLRYQCVTPRIMDNYSILRLKS